jgi:hypothetical protein
VTTTGLQLGGRGGRGGSRRTRRCSASSSTALQVARPFVRGSRPQVDTGRHRRTHQRRATALQMHRDALADVALGPADVMAGGL